ncbi:GatB/YqeY domain-containing protein [Fusibacter ferrireducens]|uniref:GatB/YqeY domain-containing protein n=1 Tax=Fusibacter ferrireducens TaxID=2785058 RepID=A0ABR9ZWS4_9FIRM|nr:GatB/YqeY domain-containing protein [Fusibacter ferrireducens]MBF4694918.1 GatB/YqeY domain-containing protein [Fusibacter ferrireducens]
MSLTNKLTDDLKDAMRSKDKVRKSVITMLRAAIKQIEIDERREVSDDDVIDIIAKQIKQKKSAIEDFSDGGREDLVDLTKTEIDLLMTYMPEQLSEEAIVEIIAKAIETTGATTMKDMGKVMGIVSEATKGKADSKHIADLVKKSLSK